MIVEQKGPLADHAALPQRLEFLGYQIRRKWVTRQGRPQPDEWRWSHPDDETRCGYARTLAEALDEIIEDWCEHQHAKFENERFLSEARLT